MKTTKLMTTGVGCLLAVFVLIAAAQSTHAQAQPDVFQSVMKSNADAITQAVYNGDDVNRVTKAGNTPLMVAAKIGDGKVLRALLENKADVNMRNKAGATALMIAAKYGHSHFVTELLRHQADPTIKNNSGFRAANFAWGYKHHDIFEELIKAERTYGALARR